MEMKRGRNLMRNLGRKKIQPKFVESLAISLRRNGGGGGNWKVSGARVWVGGRLKSIAVVQSEVETSTGECERAPGGEEKGERGVYRGELWKRRV